MESTPSLPPQHSLTVGHTPFLLLPATHHYHIHSYLHPRERNHVGLTRRLQNPRPAGKMRARQRPASQHGAQPYPRVVANPTRKIFNCIVDDTALVAGVKKSTRNGIRQWVKNGQIRLFVPLHGMVTVLKLR